MKRTLVILALPLLLASAPPSNELPAQEGAAEFNLADFEAGEPVLAYNLAVIPLHTRKGPPYDDYTVLEEAQAARKVTVSEVGDGGSVPELAVRNRDERPLYLLGGEVVLGGKQDRMVQTDVVLDPKERRRVPVVCDELQAKLPRDDRMAGLAVAINGELEVVDVFGSPTLYSKLERKLLASEEGY